MKLFYAPGTSSMGIHILLKEIGKPYELSKPDIRNGEHLHPAFSELNPKGKVPTSQRDGGSIVTEFPAIAHHLAKTDPDAGLLPTSAEAALRAAEAQGREMAGQGFDLMNKALAGKDWVTDRYSTVDRTLFYVAFWGRRMDMALPPNVAAHLDRMPARPAVRRMTDQEGLTP